MAAAIAGALALVIGGAALGVAVNELSPRGIPLLPAAEAREAPAPALPLPRGVRGLSLPEALSAIEGKTALFLDARPSEDYARGHVPGALSLPVQEFDDHFPEIADRAEEAARLIVYCEGAECSDSIHVAERLLEYGFSDVCVLEAGWRAWTEAEAPISEGAQP